MQKIAIPDCLDAIKRNVEAFLVMAGEVPGYVYVGIDTFTGTASIKHTRNPYSKTIDCSIYLPAMKAQDFLTKNELDRWIGYFIHELCHALYTDEAAWKLACAEKLHAIVNGLEDVRIERKFNASGIAANSRELLNALLAWVVSELPANYDPNDTANLAWTFALVGRVELCGYDLPEAMPHIARLSPAMRRLCNGVMAKLDAAQNTMDVLQIARDLQTIMKPKAKPEADESEEGEKPEGEKPEGESGEGKPEAKPEAEESEGENPEGEIQAGNGGVPTGDITQANEVDLKPVSGKQEAESKALVQSYDAMSEAIVIEAIRRARQNAAKPLHQVPEASRNAFDLRVESMKAAKLRAQVARVLKAEENESWDRGRAAGRLDRFAITRIGAGHVENVYAKRNIASGYETEIDVLVDASGSMGGSSAGSFSIPGASPMKAATILGYVVAQAAQQVGVKCQVSMFSSDSAMPMVVKTSNESLTGKSMSKRFSKMAMGTGGSTPLTESIIHSATRLAMRAPQKRKLVFVVSDGGCDNGPSAVKRACEYAERLGVETVALCIDIPPHDGFRLAAQCSSKDIANAGLGVLVKALSREA